LARLRAQKQAGELSFKPTRHKLSPLYFDMNTRSMQVILRVTARTFGFGMALLFLVLALTPMLVHASTSQTAQEPRVRYPSAIYGITITPSNPQPGDVVTVWADVDAFLTAQPQVIGTSLSPVIGSFRQHTAHFSLDDLAAPAVQSSEGISRYVALLGFDALAPAGVYTLSVEVTLSSGEKIHTDQPIVLAARPSYLEYITLPNSLIKTLDPEVNAQEAQTFAEIYSAYTEPGHWSRALPLPISGSFTAYYGNRRIYNGIDLGTFHSGLDIAAGIGTLVHAAAPGRVVAVTPFVIHGLSVVLDHGHGVFTTYSHLSQAGVAVGQMVREGDPLGKVGNSGRSEGPHLHFELAVGGAAVDPMFWLTNTLPGGDMAQGRNSAANNLAANDSYTPGTRAEYASLRYMERAR